MDSSKTKLAVNYLIFIIRITNLRQTAITLKNSFLTGVILLGHHKLILYTQRIHIDVLSNTKGRISKRLFLIKSLNQPRIFQKLISINRLCHPFPLQFTRPPMQHLRLTLPSIDLLQPVLYLLHTLLWLVDYAALQITIIYRVTVIIPYTLQHSRRLNHMILLLTKLQLMFDTSRHLLRVHAFFAQTFTKRYLGSARGLQIKYFLHV